MTLYGLLLVCAVQPDLTDNTQDQIRAQIVPSADELKWRQVRWHPSVWDGLRAGQAEKKPILLYMMNGHPLACT